MTNELRIGVQSKEAIQDENPRAGFKALRDAGFSCTDFSLNKYLLNTKLYRFEVNHFFDQSVAELEAYFTPHRDAAREMGIEVFQMHMPYPAYVPTGKPELNDYLRHVMAPKSLAVCAFFGCRYLVVHGFKLRELLGSEEAEWQATEAFLAELAPQAKELGITLCIENIYGGVADHIIEGPCCNARKAAERIDRMNEWFGAEVLGFCFDTGHANLVGLDFESFLTTLGARLKVLHIHDNDGVRDLHQIPYAFARTRENKSATDWDGFCHGLARIGYRGVLNFETAPVLTSFPAEMKEDVLRFLAKIGRHFSEQICGRAGSTGVFDGGENVGAI